MYYVYIVRCSDNSLYTGITLDVKRRIAEHNDSKKGARYTKSRRPVTLVHSEMFDSKSDALKREAYIKKLSREEKNTLVSRE
jgi:putative endonuclease